jgi:putative ABC transport system ATP-binding protein
MPAPALEITDLTRTFRSGCGEVRALDGVSARFDPGTWTAIMGPSGSGKSTLLLCASGLEAATSGGVRLAEVDLRSASAAAATRLRRDHLGFVFQAFNLVPSLTAAQNVALPSLLAGRRSRTSVWAIVRGTCRTSCPAGNSSASPWRERC